MLVPDSEPTGTTRMVKRIVRFEIGMRVVTPLGHVARVESVTRRDGKDAFTRIEVRYLDGPQGGSQTSRDQVCVKLQGKLLRPYEGPPVMWPDEKAAALKRAEQLLRAAKGSEE